jgi:hypothetical protein
MFASPRLTGPDPDHGDAQRSDVDVRAYSPIAVPALRGARIATLPAPVCGPPLQDDLNIVAASERLAQIRIQFLLANDDEGIPRHHSRPDFPSPIEWCPPTHQGAPASRVVRGSDHPNYAVIVPCRAAFSGHAKNLR